MGLLKVLSWKGKVHLMWYFIMKMQGLVEDHVWFEDRWMVASLCDE
jgi:hypothetical protein